MLVYQMFLPGFLSISHGVSHGLLEATQTFPMPLICVHRAGAVLRWMRCRRRQPRSGVRATGDSQGGPSGLTKNDGLTHQSWWTYGENHGKTMGTYGKAMGKWEFA